MANKKFEENSTNEVVSQPKIEEKYPIKDLIDNCKALGYTREVVAGALFNCKENELTKSEFKVIIDDFKKGKVK